MQAINYNESRELQNKRIRSDFDELFSNNGDLRREERKKKAAYSWVERSRSIFKKPYKVYIDNENYSTSSSNERSKDIFFEEFYSPPNILLDKPQQPPHMNKIKNTTVYSNNGESKIQDNFGIQADSQRLIFDRECMSNDRTL